MLFFQRILEFSLGLNIHGYLSIKHQFFPLIFIILIKNYVLSQEFRLRTKLISGQFGL